MDRSLVLVLLLFCVSYADGHTTDTNDVMKDETVCFETVTHYYSNPKITGESALVFGYKNDDFTSEARTLSCEEEDEGGKNLYIEVKSVTLSLPARDEDAKYCVESQSTSYENCKEAEQCACCEKPDETCMFTADIAQYSSCNREKHCNLTVTSQFLNDCPGRQYDCDGKKCHSRWADVTYMCRPIDVIPTPSPTTPGAKANGGLAWWIILIIILAVLLVIGVLFILYRRKYGGQEESEEDKMEATMLNTGKEYEDNPAPEEYAVVDKNKKKKKTGVDAAEIPIGNPQRQSEIQVVENENYAGFDRKPDRQKACSPQNIETTDAPTHREKTTKPAPPPPSNKPALSTLQQPPQVDGKKQESTAKPHQPSTVQSHKRAAPTKPSMAVAPPKPPGSSGGGNAMQPPKLTAPSQSRQRTTGSGSTDTPPPKPPRLSDTDTGQSPTSPGLGNNPYAKTYGHFRAEGRV